MKSALVIWNAKSGVSQNEKLIENQLTALGSDLTLHRAEVKDILDPDAVKEKFPITECEYIIAIGGDGTANAAANLAMVYECALVIIPTGTFNHFAVHIGVPRDIEKAFTVFKTGKREYLDIGKINDRVFLNFVSIGYYTDIIRTRVSREQHGSSKLISFFKALFRETFRNRRHTLEFTGQAGSVIKRTPLLFIGNGVFRFGSTDILSTRESFCNNKIHLAIFKNYSRLRLFMIGIASMLFDTTKWLVVENYPLTSCVVRDTHSAKITMAIDGEVVTMHGELQVSSLSRALCVVVPKSATLT